MRTIPLAQLLSAELFDQLMHIDTEFASVLGSWIDENQKIPYKQAFANAVYTFIADLITHALDQQGEVRRELIEFLYTFEKRFAYGEYSYVHFDDFILQKEIHITIGDIYDQEHITDTKLTALQQEVKKRISLQE